MPVPQELRDMTDRAADTFRRAVELLSMVRLEEFLRRLGLGRPQASPASPRSSPSPSPTIAPVLRRPTWEEYIRRVTNPNP
jgi:preprotein translocase subunit Sss1